MEIHTQEGDIKNNEAVDLQDWPRDGNSQFLKQLPISVDSGTTGDIVSLYVDTSVCLSFFNIWTLITGCAHNTFVTVSTEPCFVDLLSKTFVWISAFYNPVKVEYYLWCLI